jgi:glycosyltransferase involved in cell wall biosynthesis
VADPGETSIVIPAYNEGRVIGEVVSALTPGRWREILVVDDGSSDDTTERARAAGARVVQHPYNKGNGASVKTGIRQATGEFVVILDADGQHRPADASRLVASLGQYDLVVGARSPASQATSGRRIGNGLLNRLAGYLTGRPIPDLTSGFRAARRSYLLELLHLLPNGFSTPTTITLAFIKAGHNVTFEPIEAGRRVGQSKVKLARDGFKFFLILLKVITIYSPLRVFVPISLVSFTVGAAYAAWTIVRQQHVTNSSVLLIMLAVIVLVVGLLSEQISALWFEGRR